MQNVIKIAEDFTYVGGSDRRIALFENVYPVPRGMSYNSYLLKDEKTVLFDTVDSSVCEQFLENLACALGGRKLDFLVVHHMEPDHSASLRRVLSLYPGVKIVTSQKAAQMMANFFSLELENAQIVKEGDVLETGKHRIRFIAAPMVHWPEVMMSFEETEGILFSADAFGTFGALDGNLFADGYRFESELLPEARRYYFNIVGKYGVQVQNVLKKAAGLTVRTVCPLHGPIWRKEFGSFLAKYDLWSKYLPEEDSVALFYGTVYGHTGEAAQFLASVLAEKGVKTAVYDTSKTELSTLVSEAFRCRHVVFLSATYNNGIFLPMEHLLRDLGEHFYQNRSYSIVECGSWAPQAGELMEKLVLSWKNMTKIGEKITILSSVKEPQKEALKSLAETISAAICGGAD